MLLPFSLSLSKPKNKKIKKLYNQGRNRTNSTPLFLPLSESSLTSITYLSKNKTKQKIIEITTMLPST